MRIGIIGNGFVGSAIMHGFILHTEDIKIYDKDPKRSTHSLKEVVENSDFVFLCLPTPMFESGECDLSIINSVMDEIEALDISLVDQIFIVKSTVPPGTTESLVKNYTRCAFVFNPEFLTERKARLDFINTSRIVLGGASVFVDRVEELYKIRFPYTKVIKTSYQTAELIKYMANCFFATKVSFMNEMYQVCEAIDGDWEKALEGFITDGRIGNSHIDVPGHDGDFGFGGKCFPKDLNAMIKRAEAIGVSPDVMKGAWEKNKQVRSDLDWYDIPGAVSDKKKK